MKKLLLLLSIFPVIALAQGKAKKNSVNDLPKAEGYTITGEVSGFPDGTTVSLLANNGAPEATSTMTGGKFILKGKMNVPDFKVLAFNSQPPYIAMFVDNSEITVKASKENLDNAAVKGSPANDEYLEYLAITKPYDDLIAKKENVDPSMEKKMVTGLEKFVKKRPNSYVAPLAIYRIHQVNEDGEQMEKMYGSLTPEVRSGPIGSYIAQQIAESKKNPMGKELPDFAQADTAGNPVSLSSLKGKYVLVDFWASWCGPCRMENPNVVNVYNKYKDRNFTVLGVSLDKSKQPWIDAIAKDQLTWTHVSDLKGWGNAVAQQFQITSIPQNFLVDPSGKVIGKNLRGDALDQKLSSVIK